MFAVKCKATGEIVYKHYDRTECVWAMIDLYEAVEGRPNLGTYEVIELS